MIDFHGMQLRPSATVDVLKATDWRAAELGVPAHWPPVLRTTIQLCLNSQFPMMLIWGDGLAIVYNDAFLPIMGDKHPAGFAQPAVRVFPELIPALQEPLQAVQSGRTALFEEDRLLPLMRGGQLQEAYFTFSYTPVNDQDGVACGVLAVATETTEYVLQQRRAATLGWLAEELARQSALEPISAAMQHTFRGNRADLAVTALLGVAADGSYALEWCDPSDHASALLAALGEHHVVGSLCRGGRHTSVIPVGERTFALTMVDDDALDGSAYVLLVQAGELVKIDSDYRGMLRMLQESLIGAVYRILSERRALDAVTRRLDERDRLYRLLFERSQDGIFICSPGGQITAANPAGCALLGYTEQEVRELGRSGVVVDDGGNLAHCMAERSRRGAFLGELTFRHKDGTQLAVDVSSTLFRDDDSGEERAITLFRDAAPRLVTQERIASTARLEAVGALTGGIAHDFNNLLNVIINGAEDVVERLPEGGEIRASADIVLTAAVRAADLTRQLLAFSRQQPMAPRSADIGLVVGELDQMLSRTMGGNIEVNINVGSGDYAFTDRALLQSAILNLCINARDAMPEGGTVTVCTRAVRVAGDLAEEINLDAGDFVRIRVADTGVGIPPEHLGRILEPFFTTKPVGHGTGLGLSMVFGFARQSGGSMRVRSRPGQGTCVDLYLPVAEPDPTDESREPVPAVQAVGPGPAVRKHLLVVEDEDLLATMLGRILEDAGYQVTVCRDGESALKVLGRRSGYALVLTDILLGSGIDGWTLQQRIEERWPALPVVTMSGFTPLGPDRAPNLHKPFRPREVLALLGNVLAG